MSFEAARVAEEIAIAIKSGQQQLPGLPDIAIRVRNAITKQDADVQTIAKLIQSDIPLTARMIQIANSPLYRGVVPVEDCLKAVTRLGLDVTKNLVTSFALRRAFSAKNSKTRKRVENVWKHSVQVGAIAFILGRITPRFNPDLGMLGALIHDVGVLPLYAYAERHKSLLNDAETLDRLEKELRIELGKMVLTHWRFDHEFIEIIEAAEDWMRDPTPEADYGDMVLIAQVHAAFGKSESESMPPLEQLPALKKFPVFKLGPAASMELLAEAQDEMKELQKLLAE